MEINVFLNACKVTGENPEDAKFNSGSIDTIAYEKLKVIVKAKNQGWKAAFDNGNQLKWMPYFEKRSSGLVFVIADYWLTCALVPSHLCFRDEETLTETVTNPEVLALYNEYMLS